jgi:hypothetical protein
MLLVMVLDLGKLSMDLEIWLVNSKSIHFVFKMLLVIFMEFIQLGLVECGCF